ncbi:50S ribosomal protein L22 [Riemerella anatipestifer]|uniref:50S ribosomal protein L22 n=1 Tax=Riemerella anatipestifer TaxID=34085 RepID=UPI001BDA4BB1|nr:50S ribosomal protein L22 [Riemerella anatipestifer]MBT0549285.1 50S ribosomal protein L22 [Riemerella anatipestifer]MBT0560048.1 50S ribosomal protein L22 [Riemerella anatipestifer]
MGKRKQDSAIARKAANQDVVKARLNDCPSSPRKMRLVADIIRGENVDKTLYILRYSKKEASNKLEKLLLSAIANWQNKNEGADIEEANLFVKEIYVDSARQLKRLRPAPRGRGYRIRKRSNHVTLVLGSKTDNQ